jgi:hypothetical protein
LAGQWQRRGLSVLGKEVAAVIVHLSRLTTLTGWMARVDNPSRRLGVYRHALLVVRVDDRAEARGDSPSNPSLAPDPLAFWNSVVPRSSYTQISDPRSIALPIAMAGLLVGS